jgi:hypothetical protein
MTSAHQRLLAAAAALSVMPPTSAHSGGATAADGSIRDGDLQQQDNIRDGDVRQQGNIRDGDVQQQQVLNFPHGPLLELNVSGHILHALLPALMQLKGSRLHHLLSADEAALNEQPAGVSVKQITGHGRDGKQGAGISTVPGQINQNLLLEGQQAGWLTRLLPRDTCGRLYLPYDPLCFALLVQLLHMQYTLGVQFMDEDIHTAVSAAYDSACRSLHLMTSFSLSSADYMLASTSHHADHASSFDHGPASLAASSSRPHHHHHHPHHHCHNGRTAAMMPMTLAPSSSAMATKNVHLQPEEAAARLFAWRWRGTEHALGPFPVSWKEAVMTLINPSSSNTICVIDDVRQQPQPGFARTGNTADHSSSAFPTAQRNVLHHNPGSSVRLGPYYGTSERRDEQQEYMQQRQEYIQQQQHSVGNMYAIMEMLSQRQH